MSRFVVDAHVHSLRFRPGLLKAGEEWSYRSLEQKIYTSQPFDNTPQLLRDMAKHGVDFCLISSAFNMRNDMILEQVKQHPQRFRGLCNCAEMLRRVQAGEGEFDIQQAADEIDGWLAHAEFAGIGEAYLFPSHSDFRPLDQCLEDTCRFMEVARKHKKPILFHTGFIRYPTVRLRLVDPIWIDDLACIFPDVPIVIGHMGVQAGWYRTFPENALMVAARHPQVYLETSQAPSDLIERAYLDPHIGPSKIMFGSDYGASISYARVGDTTMAVTATPPTYLPDHFAWNLKQVMDIRMTEDERDLVLGLNAARVFGIDTEASG